MIKLSDKHLIFLVCKQMLDKTRQTFSVEKSVYINDKKLQE